MATKRVNNMSIKKQFSAPQKAVAEQFLSRNMYQKLMREQRIISPDWSACARGNQR